MICRSKRLLELWCDPLSRWKDSLKRITNCGLDNSKRASVEVCSAEYQWPTSKRTSSYGTLFLSRQQWKPTKKPSLTYGSKYSKSIHLTAYLLLKTWISQAWALNSSRSLNRNSRRLRDLLLTLSSTQRSGLLSFANQTVDYPFPITFQSGANCTLYFLSRYSNPISSQAV